MIAPLSVEVGRPVRFEGYAEDYGVPIVTVQFSLDDGENWTDYDVSASGRSMGSLDVRVHPRGAGNLLPARALGQRAWRGKPGAGYRYLYRLRAGRLGAAV